MKGFDMNDEQYRRRQQLEGFVMAKWPVWSKAPISQEAAARLAEQELGLEGVTAREMRRGMRDSKVSTRWPKTMPMGHTAGVKRKPRVQSTDVSADILNRVSSLEASVADMQEKVAGTHECVLRLVQLWETSDSQ